jgi:hypothetical protein
MKKGAKRLLLMTAALFSLILGTLASCSSTIRPPLHPKDPIRVYLLKDALHVGVVLPEESDRYVEYGFGDWGWYAMNHDSWYHVFDTVLWPTQGCLGRSWMRDDSVQFALKSGKLTPLQVDRARVDGLLADLERRFDRNASTRVYNPAYKMYFVEDERGFWFLYNCHDAVAEWMEMLGCDVSWAWLRLDLEVAEP